MHVKRAFMIFLHGALATPNNVSRLVFPGQLLKYPSFLNTRSYPDLPNANYYGGPIIGSVKIILIFWGGKFKISDHWRLETYYTQLVQSPYFDWLQEYNTPKTNFTKSTYIGSYDYSKGLKGSITDAQIQAGIKYLIEKKLVTASSNTYFAIHFAPGISITQSQGVSCIDFCAYHSAFAFRDFNIIYGVNPSFKGTNCDKGCGASRNKFDNVCATASHELVEAMTDPLISDATTIAYPLGWYDPTYGEIGDYCNQQQHNLSWSAEGTKYSIVVQSLWSNHRRRCVTQ